MKVPAQHTTKLDDRSKLVVHFGRELGTKAYLLFDPIAQKIHISRNVLFNEDKTWPWETTITVDTPGADKYTFDFPETIPHDVTTEPVTVPEVDTGSPTTPSQQTQSSSQLRKTNADVPRDAYDDSVTPRKFRCLDDIYDHTTEVKMVEEELLLMGIDEPVCFEQAVHEPKWKDATDKEIEAIKKNHTWVLTNLPMGHKAIDLKWVFKLKTDQHGEITKHKARLVAKGYVQRHRIDYEDVFSPMTRLETVRLLLALAAKHNWEVHHLDVKSAFLNGVLQEEVYVSQPKGYAKEGREHMVYRLLKALYGLRQAPRAWYARLNQYLLKLGFVKCPFEHAVYLKHDGADSLIVGVCVDDLIVTGTNVSDILKFKGEMGREFDMSDLGKLSYYLGLEVAPGCGFIQIRQTSYAKKVLERAGLAECNSVKYPIEYKI